MKSCDENGVCSIISGNHGQPELLLTTSINTNVIFGMASALAAYIVQTDSKQSLPPVVANILKDRTSQGSGWVRSLRKHNDMMLIGIKVRPEASVQRLLQEEASMIQRRIIYPGL